MSSIVGGRDNFEWTKEVKIKKYYKEEGHTNNTC